jgi:hypothetical protein
MNPFGERRKMQRLQRNDVVILQQFRHLDDFQEQRCGENRTKNPVKRHQIRQCPPTRESGTPFAS